MKKRELILDFTSLLDVIMILLFVVLSNMSLATMETGAEAKKQVAEKEAKVEELSDQVESLQAQAENLREMEQKYKQTQQELDALKENYDALWEEYDYLKIISDFDASNTAVYEKVIQHMAKVVLICETKKNEQTGNQEVEVGIYLVSGREEQKAHAGTIVLLHDFSLSKEQREALEAKQVTEATGKLSEALRYTTEDVVWFSVQYSYEDENFSHSDMEILNEAIGNLERSFSKTCYIEKIKIY